MADVVSKLPDYTSQLNPCRKQHELKPPATVSSTAHGKSSVYKHEKSHSRPSETGDVHGCEGSLKSSQNAALGTKAQSKLDDNLSSARQALVEVGVREDLVQLAIEILFLRNRHELSTARQELFNLALDISDDPTLRKMLTEERKAAQERHQFERTAKGQREEISDIEEDGCGAKDSGRSLQDDVDNAKDVAACSLQPETGQKPKDAPQTKKKLRQKVQILEEENRKLQHRKLCRMCRKVELATSGITFLPCGHFITCEDCAEKCDDCPACGKNIMGTVRTFLS